MTTNNIDPNDITENNDSVTQNKSVVQNNPTIDSLTKKEPQGSNLASRKGNMIAKNSISDIENILLSVTAQSHGSGVRQELLRDYLKSDNYKRDHQALEEYIQASNLEARIDENRRWHSKAADVMTHAILRVRFLDRIATLSQSKENHD